MLEFIQNELALDDYINAIQKEEGQDNDDDDAMQPIFAENLNDEDELFENIITLKE